MGRMKYKADWLPKKTDDRCNWWEMNTKMRTYSKISHLFILNLECGEAGQQLLTPLEQLTFQWLLRTHYSHLYTYRSVMNILKYWHLNLPSCRQTQTMALYRVSHVGLEVKASWGAEDIVVGFHQFLFVSVGLQTLSCSLQCLQTSVFGCLYILLCR